MDIAFQSLVDVTEIANRTGQLETKSVSDRVARSAAEPCLLKAKIHSFRGYGTLRHGSRAAERLP